MSTKKSARPTTNFKGDAAEYTGKTVERFGKTFYEVKITEGRNKGDLRVVAQAPGGDVLAEAPKTKKTKDPKVACASSTICRSAPGPKLVYGLKVGQRIAKQFKGREYVVDVTTDGYLVDGQQFRTITGAAKHITGYGISGPVFFGLVGGEDK